MLTGKHIVLGVSGSIACYKAADLASALVQRGAEVQVVMTAAAQHFISPLTFESLTHRPVVTNLYHESDPSGLTHIRLAQWADVLAMVPATADLLARLAHGLADDSLTCTALACPAPLVLAPAMNTQMYLHPATQANREVLAQRGALFVGPEEGRLAEGMVGIGRLARLEWVIDAISMALGARGDLAGAHVVVTAGPTREHIDPVRYISNRSSGKMGYALAIAARDRGARVTLIAGPTALPDPLGITLRHVHAAAEMAEALHEVIDSAAVLVMAAAVADYRPTHAASQKIKRTADVLTLQLEPTEDIVAGVRKRPDLLTVGFAAETNDVLAHAEAKRTRKGLHLLVANDVTEPGAGFDTETNHVWVLSADQPPIDIPLASKAAIADRILDHVVQMRAAQSAGISTNI